MNIPNHVAIILDGNGRWAKSKGMPRNYGHVRGAQNLEVICRDAYNMGIKYLTVYLFSTENWKRSPDEVDALMKLFRRYTKTCIRTARDNNMKVRVLGDPTALADDLQRMEACTPGQLYNLHPGSHVGQGVQAGIEKLSALLNELLRPEMTTTVLLETMAGKGSEIGGKFEELREIIDRVELKDKLGVCLDTCHIWDGGYDIVSDPDAVFAEFDRVIGLDKLRAVHLNNSLNLLDSHKDRHAKILEGKLPPEALARIVCHEALAGRPIILETPNDDAGYAAEIAWLREQWAARHG